MGGTLNIVQISLQMSQNNSAGIVLADKVGFMTISGRMAEHYSPKVEKTRFFVIFVREVP